MWLESIVDESENGSYEIHFRETNILECDVEYLLSAMADDAIRGTSSNMLSARFHNSMADLIVKTVRRISGGSSSNMVGLTGGCFQNKRLTELTSDKLQKAGYNVFTINLNHHEGKVSEIDESKGKLKVLVNMFGRNTPVELDSLQIKKV